MALRYFSLFIISLLGFSCTEQEVVPRTNPRFSVAFVQSIDKSGAEFAASVFDYGSDEILEYGFVYGKQTNLSVLRDNFVSEQGVPPQEFRLKSTHSMPIGNSINVAAFIRTNTGVIYSKPYQFTSQGSDGFIFDRMEVADEVYFGDTIRIFARNLSRLPEDYSVLIQRSNAIIASVSEGFFDVIIPRSVGFQEGLGPIQNFEFEIKVSDKVLKVNQAIRFKSPEIISGSSGDLAYNEYLVISGKYLYDDNLRVKYLNKEGQNFILESKRIGDNELLVGLNALFSEPNPRLELIIRGQSDPVSGLLRLKETKINPGQSTKFKSFSGIVKIQGENFNPYNFDYNKLEVNPDLLKLEVLSLSSSQMEIAYEFQFDKGPGYRIFELNIDNAGIRSQNALTIEWTRPNIPYIVAGQQSMFLEDGKSTSVLGKGYLLHTNGIFEVDVQTRGFRKVAENPIPGIQPAQIFVLPVEGKIYFATFSGDEFSEKLFFVFDPVTRLVNSLPSIPSSDNSFQSIVFHQGKLYYQGDDIDRLTGKDGNIQRFKFDLATKSWEKLTNLSQPDEVINYYPSYRYNGKTYSISINTSANFPLGPALFIFNTTTFTWEYKEQLQGELSLFQVPNELIVIDNKVYIKSLYRLQEVDLETKQIEGPSNINGDSGNPYSTNLFQLGNKFYLFYNDRYWEYDPVFFD